MNGITLFAIYFIFWWITLFVTLPFGMKSQADVGEVTPGTEPAAPANPQIKKRMFYNTILSGILFGIFWYVTQYLGYSVDDLPMIIDVN